MRSPAHRHLHPLRVLLAGVLFLAALRGHAWVYPEHRSIALLAIEEMGSEDRALLERLWTDARLGHEGRLTPLVVDAAQGRNPMMLDFAAWPAISGDHSCSPQDMLRVVLDSEWVLKVADVAARLQHNLDLARRSDQTVNAIRDGDIRLQRADIDYATRAGANNVHFLMARQYPDVSPVDYFAQCLKEGAELNALGAYGRFHTMALEKVVLASDPALSATQRAVVLRAALADEAFALHFIQDAFAAGHVAGSWGDTPSRMGTHEHYNEKGLEVMTWNGEQVVLTGDAHMRLEDAQRAAVAVRISLEQFLGAARSGPQAGAAAPQGSDGPDTLDVCANTRMPAGGYDMALLGRVLAHTPIPALGEGVGSLPRFRAEIGPFIGASTAVGLYGLDGGFGKLQTDGGGIGSIEANLMFGFGMDGVLNKAGDGLVFVQFGVRQDSPSTGQIIPATQNFQSNTLLSAIPGRWAYNLRVRLPFWLIPGDVILAGPILGLASPKNMRRMAVTAGNGGVIPWQTGISTPVGRFQFVLGREVGVSFFGLGNTQDALFIPDALGDVSLVSYRSTKWDFPIIEYRPTRTFSQDQSAAVKAQFSFGVDTPSHVKVLAPDYVTSVDLRPVWYIGVRFVFNWRRYL
jgi:hypothetical protein